jgi:hypothetical protein
VGEDKGKKKEEAEEWRKAWSEGGYYIPPTAVFRIQ